MFVYKFSIVLITLIATLGLSYLIFPCREKDRLAYQELLKNSNPIENEVSLSFSQQKRKNVKKSIWYQEKSPLQIRIESPESELFLSQKKKKIELVEQLRNVTCLMQEELFYLEGKPMQKIRYMEAAQASYHYTTHLFAAKDVKLWKYQIEGHTLPPNLIHEVSSMSATAQSMELSLQGNQLDCTAHHMRAIVNSNEQTL